MRHPLPAPVSVHSYHRWCQRPVGRSFVQMLVVVLTLQGFPLPELRRQVRWRSPVSLTWLASVVPSSLPVPRSLSTLTTQWLGQQTAQAHGQASRIFTIEPSCAQPGDTVTITGNGFGALNMDVYVGGQETGHGVITGGLLAPEVSAYGNRATFLVPQEAPGGVTIVWAVNPGDHAGSIAFRVQQTEVCGNSVDEDCDGQLDDVDICVPVNHSPIAEAGLAQTAPVGTTIQLDGTGSSDPDGDLLSFQWTLTPPSGSSATLSDPTSATPSFTLDRGKLHSGLECQ